MGHSVNLIFKQNLSIIVEFPKFKPLIPCLLDSYLTKVNIVNLKTVTLLAFYKTITNPINSQLVRL